MARAPEAKHRGVFERPRGSGDWWIRYADEHGRIRREKVGAKNLALRFYTRRKAEVAERRFFPERVRRRDVLLADFIRDYLARLQGTLRSYVDLERHGRVWQAALGDRPLRQVVARDVQHHVARRLTEVRPASVNRELVGSTGRCNVLCFASRRGGGGHGTDGTARSVRGEEAGTLAALEGWSVAE